MVLGLGSACGGSTAQTPQIEVHILQDMGVRDLAAAAAAHGYPVVVMQPDFRRFGVLAHYRRGLADDTGYRFAVQCPSTMCFVIPYGPRTERRPDGWLLPPGLREELLDFQSLLQSAPRRAAR